MAKGVIRSTAPFIKVKKGKVNKNYFIPLNTVHIYSDACFNQELKIGTYASVIITHQGWFYKAGKLSSASCPNDAEFRTAINSLYFLEESVKSEKILKPKKIVIYTDSLTVIKSLKDKSDLSDPNSSFFYLKSYFNNWTQTNDIEVDFYKVKAHAENMSVITVINNFCDELAKSQMTLAIVEEQKPKLRISDTPSIEYQLVNALISRNTEEFLKLAEAHWGGLLDRQKEFIWKKLTWSLESNPIEDERLKEFILKERYPAL